MTAAASRWKLAWDVNPPAPGDIDYEAYLEALPAEYERLEQLYTSEPEAGAPQATTYSNGHERVTPPEPDPIEGEPSAERIREQAGANERESAGILTVSELAALPSADEEYIVADGILTRGGKLLTVAKSGVGKTTMMHDLVGCLAMGRPWLGRYAIDRPRRVLVVQGELSLPEMSSHAQQLLGAGYDSDGLTFARMTDLRLPDGEQTLRGLIAAAGAEIVALDPWYRLFAGESSNASEQVDSVFKVCDRLLEDGTVEAVIVVHHANVTGLRTAGSWVFEGWPSTILRLELVPGLDDHRMLSFDKVRAPSSSLLGLQFQIALGERGYLAVIPKAPETGAGPTLAAQIVAEAGGQLHRQELVQRLMVRAGCKERAAAKYLGEAVQLGRLKRVPDGQMTLYQVMP